MAMTQNNWVKATSTDGFNKWTCTIVTGGTDLNDVYTKKTPAELDGSREWYAQVSASATADAQALPLDLWLGYNDSFALSGDGATVTAGDNGGKYKQISDDIVLAVTTLKHTFIMDPNWPIADIDTVAAILDGYHVRTPDAPYYAFNCNGGSTLASATMTFTISQRATAGSESNLGITGDALGGDGTTGVGPDPS
jgi:hypothetical protein